MGSETATLSESHSMGWGVLIVKTPLDTLEH